MLKYLADSELVDRVAYIDAALYKEAGYLSDTLGSVSNAVQNYVLNRVDTSSPVEAGKGLLDIMAPAMFFSVHPLLGVLVAVAESFGFNLSDVLSKIVDVIRPSLEKGEPVESSKINEAAGLSATAADGFADLRKLAQDGSLYKHAQLFGRRRRNYGAYNSVLYRVFEFLTPMKRRTLFTSFIIWFVKTLLKGAGMLLIGGVLANALRPKKEAPTQPSTQPMPAEPSQAPATMPASYQVPAPVTVNWAASGRGEKYLKNDAENAWMVPVFGNVKNTLLLWATEIYPELKGREQEISSIPSFNRIANILEENMDPSSPNWLVMPAGFNRRIDVVNQFAKDIPPAKKETTDEQNI